MAVQKRPSQHVEVDLDATVELPAVDFADVEGASALLAEESAVTDVFPAPVIPAGVVELADSLREVEQRLQRKIERVARLEAELGEARQQIDTLREQQEQAERTTTERETTLRADLAAIGQREVDLQRDNSTLRDSMIELRAQLQAQHAALGESQTQAAQRASVQRHQELDLAQLRRRSERQHEALSTWQGFRAVSESMLGERDAQLRGVDAQHAAALAELQTAQQAAAAQVAALETSLREAQTSRQLDAQALQVATQHAEQQAVQLVARDATIADQQQQLDALRALEEKARHAAGVHDEQQRQIALLQIELSAANAQLRDAESQLRAANDRVQRLESEAHASAALLGNLQQNMERLGREDTGSRPALKLVAAEPALRVLLRQEGGSELAYPLGRRTTVGRTPENDIQIDTTFVSRHHAVLLSNSDHCIVEDLNSTNGVLVNGRRVGRQILHDGDTVTVGRTEFIYQQRS
jgi:FHA domain